MQIAADEVIPYVHAAFADAGEVTLFSGREVRSEDIRRADALIVRSVTTVGAGLLDSSAVRFVGTASIGTDHLDLDYLEKHGIFWTNAAGSNANSVSEYVLAALLEVAHRRGWDLNRKSLGVVGVGRIGSLVSQKAAMLGMEVLLCDPPLRDRTGDDRYGHLEDVLGADILTLHVPLVKSGPYPTRHMINASILNRLNPHQILFNTSRGEVVCNADLKQALVEGRIGGAVLDVWEQEPAIDAELLKLVEIGTAHIAGSSLDGKIRGTAMVLEEFCRYFGIRNGWNPRNLFSSARTLCPESGLEGQSALHSVVLQAYDIRRDDASLREGMHKAPAAAAAHFDYLRNCYQLRPEFSHFIVDSIQDTVRAGIYQPLGFQMEDTAVIPGRN